VQHDFRPIAEKSIDELEGHSMPPPFASGLTQRIAVARRVPLRRLSIEQLRLLIGQGEAAVYLLPIALDRLDQDPLAEGDFGRGDLLMAVLRAEHYWFGQLGLRGRMRGIIDRALTRLGEVQPVEWPAGELSDPAAPDEVDRRNLEPELRAALERFG
jgi:hypothetical protein